MTKLSLISKQQPLAIKAHVSSALGSTGFKVMCATDLWGESDHALRKALWLAEEMDAELLLLHVVDGETPLRISGRRAEHAHGALEWHVRRWPDFKPRPAISVRIGNPHRTISRVAQEWRADLIVLGSSRPRLMDRFLATTAERAAAEARCAVLVVNDGKPQAYRHVTIVAPSRGQAAALEQVMSKLEVLHASRRMDVRIGGRTASLLRQPDCVIVTADRWPALSGLFRRSRASLLAQSKAMDLLIVPHRNVAVA